MISRFTLLALPLLGVFCFACGSILVGNGQPGTETRTVPPFTLVNASDGVQVRLTLDPAQSGDVSLEVSAETNVLSSVVTEVANNTLGVGVGGTVQTNLPIEVTGTVNFISNAQAYGGSLLALQGVDSDGLTLGSTEGASLSAEGTVNNLVVTAGDGGLLDGADLTATSAEVVISNGALATLCVTGRVTGAVSNGGSLTVECGGDTSGVITSTGGIVR